jgi:cation diffusion facilitator family transporter
MSNDLTAPAHDQGGEPGGAHDTGHGHGHGHGHDDGHDAGHAAVVAVDTHADHHDHDDHVDHDDHGHDDHGHGHGDGDHDHAHATGIWAKIKHTLVPHAHDANEAIQSAEEASSTGIRAAWIGLAGMMATAILQVVIVWISGSIALLADTLHNLGHAATTIPLVLAFMIGRRAPNKRYPYGYRRAEDIVGLFISAVIAASIVLIVWESVDALINPHKITNLWWVFAAGLIGAVGNELVAVYRIRAGKKIGSAALIAEGQHARADGFTSIAVVAGVVGVWLGFDRADAIVGLFIAVVVSGILFNSMRIIIRRLMDGVEDGVIDSMTSAAVHVDGVTGVESMRARWGGHRLSGEAVITVAPGQTVESAHAIAEAVEHRLLLTVAHMDGVSVHVHPQRVEHPLTSSLR